MLGLNEVPDLSDGVALKKFITREPISIFSQIKNVKDEEKKEKLNLLLEALREKLPEGFKVGVAVGKGDCFFDSVAQGLNGLKDKGLITSSKGFSVKSLRESCKQYAQQVNQSKRGSWLGDALNVEDDKLYEYIPRIEFTSEDIENASSGSEIEILKLENVIWGRSEIEGKMICEKYSVKIRIIELRDEGIDGVHVTKGDVGTGNNIIYIVNYRSHFVPLLSSIEKDIEESEKVSREEVFGIVDKNSLSLLGGVVDPIGSSPLREQSSMFHARGPDKKNRSPEDISPSKFISETSKRNYREWLKQEDIAGIAKLYYRWYGENNNVLFEIIGYYDQLKVQLRRGLPELQNQNKQSLIYIVNLNNDHWVTLVITHHNNQFIAYYIDSFGDRIPDNINNLMNQEFPDINVQAFNDIKQQNDGYNCGIFALENARIINEGISSSETNSLEQKLRKMLLSTQQLEGMRREFADLLQRNNTNLSDNDQFDDRVDTSCSEPDDKSEEDYVINTLGIGDKLSSNSSASLSYESIKNELKQYGSRLYIMINNMENSRAEIKITRGKRGAKKENNHTIPVSMFLECIGNFLSQQDLFDSIEGLIHIFRRDKYNVTYYNYIKMSFKGIEEDKNSYRRKLDALLTDELKPSSKEELEKFLKDQTIPRYEKDLQTFLRYELIPCAYLMWNGREVSSYYQKKTPLEFGAEGAKVKSFNANLKHLLNEIPKDLEQLKTKMNELLKKFFEEALDLPKIIEEDYSDKSSYLKERFKSISSFLNKKIIDNLFEQTKDSSVFDGKTAKTFRKMLNLSETKGKDQEIKSMLEKFGGERIRECCKKFEAKRKFEVAIRCNLLGKKIKQIKECLNEITNLYKEDEELIRILSQLSSDLIDTMEASGDASKFETIVANTLDNIIYDSYEIFQIVVFIIELKKSSVCQQEGCEEFFNTFLQKSNFIKELVGSRPNQESRLNKLLERVPKEWSSSLKDSCSLFVNTDDFFDDNDYNQNDLPLIYNLVKENLKDDYTVYSEFFMNIALQYALHDSGYFPKVFIDNDQKKLFDRMMEVTVVKNEEREGKLVYILILKENKTFREYTIITNQNDESKRQNWKVQEKNDNQEFLEQLVSNIKRSEIFFTERKPTAPKDDVVIIDYQRAHITDAVTNPAYFIGKYYERLIKNVLEKGHEDIMDGGEDILKKPFIYLYVDYLIREGVNSEKVMKLVINTNKHPSYKSLWTEHKIIGNKDWYLLNQKIEDSRNQFENMLSSSSDSNNKSDLHNQAQNFNNKSANETNFSIEDIQKSLDVIRQDVEGTEVELNVGSDKLYKQWSSSRESNPEVDSSRSNSPSFQKEKQPTSNDVSEESVYSSPEQNSDSLINGLDGGSNFEKQKSTLEGDLYLSDDSGGESNSRNRVQDLFNLVKNGTLNKLFELNKDPSAFKICNFNGDTLLHCAAENNKLNFIVYLKNKINVNSKNKNGKTPLYYAIEKNYDSLVKKLLSCGADINVEDNNGMTPLDFAIKKGSTTIINLLLSNNTLKDDTKNSALFTAINSFNDDAVDSLLKNNANVNTRDSNGKTPLDFAVEKNYDSLVKKLLSCGADINVEDNNGMTPLDFAIKKGSTTIINLLLSNNTLKDDTKNSALFTAINSFNDDAVDSLLKNNANVNTRDSNGKTPLDFAVEKNYDSLVKKLLSCGADINVEDNNGMTPLDFAIKKGSTTIINLLLSNDTLKDDTKKAALFTAINCLNLKAIDSLLKKNVAADGLLDYLASDNCDIILLYSNAIIFHLVDLFMVLLLQTKIDINAEDRNHITLLSHLKMRQCVTMTNLLQRKGVKIEIEEGEILSSCPCSSQSFTTDNIKNKDDDKGSRLSNSSSHNLNSTDKNYDSISLQSSSNNSPSILEKGSEDGNSTSYFPETMSNITKYGYEGLLFTIEELKKGPPLNFLSNYTADQHLQGAEQNQEIFEEEESLEHASSIEQSNNESDGSSHSSQRKLNNSECGIAVESNSLFNRYNNISEGNIPSSVGSRESCEQQDSDRKSGSEANDSWSDSIGSQEEKQPTSGEKEEGSGSDNSFCVLEQGNKGKNSNSHSLETTLDRIAIEHDYYVKNSSVNVQSNNGEQERFSRSSNASESSTQEGSSFEHSNIDEKNDIELGSITSDDHLKQQENNFEYNDTSEKNIPSSVGSGELCEQQVSDRKSGSEANNSRSDSIGSQEKKQPTSSEKGSAHSLPRQNGGNPLEQASNSIERNDLQNVSLQNDAYEEERNSLSCNSNNNSRKQESDFKHDSTGSEENDVDTSNSSSEQESSAEHNDTSEKSTNEDMTSLGIKRLRVSDGNTQKPPVKKVAQSDSPRQNVEEVKIEPSVGSNKSYGQQGSGQESSLNNGNNSQKQESDSEYGGTSEKSASRNLNNIQPNSENQEIFSRSSSTSGKNDNDNLSEENCSRSSSPDSQEVEHTASNDISEESSGDEESVYNSPEQNGSNSLGQKNNASVDDIFKEKFTTANFKEEEFQSTGMSIIQFLVEESSANDSLSDSTSPQKDEEGCTQLHVAAADGNNEFVKTLLKKGDDVNSKNKHGRTPLHDAVVNGNNEIVKTLLEGGASIDSKDKDDCTPLRLALADNEWEIVRILLEKVANDSNMLPIFNALNIEIQSPKTTLNSVTLDNQLRRRSASF